MSRLPSKSSSLPTLPTIRSASHPGGQKSDDGSTKGNSIAVLNKPMKPKVREALGRLAEELFRTGTTTNDLYAKIDENSDGVLTRLELHRGLRSLGVTLHAVELDAVLRMFDSDGNGDIDFEEFAAVLEAVRGHTPAAAKTMICGFEQGSRVLSKVVLKKGLCSYVEHLGTPRTIKTTRGTVLGPGRERDTVLVRLDRTIGEWSMKPNQLAPLSGKLAAMPASARRNSTGSFNFKNAPLIGG